MLFAALILERESMQWAKLPAALMSWVQDAGVVATIGLALVGLYRLVNRQSLFGERGNFIHQVVAICGCGAVGCLLAFLVLLNLQGTIPEFGPDRRPIAHHYTVLQHLFLTGGGALALLGAAAPMVMTCLRTLSWRRIYALAKLSVLEAIRGRVVWVFALMLLVYLFADWFVVYQPHEQIRAYLGVVYWATAMLLLILAAMLGAFSIPNDVVRQTIHTVVTKPVEKYEIVLGRFFGYGFLLTVGLGVLSLLSLVYISRGLTPGAEKESYKARVPLFGDHLIFAGTPRKEVGENVGREWGYRSYIRGRGPQAVGTPRQYAIWTFDSLPGSLRTRQEPVSFEFTFDIYRMTKGTENVGVFCQLTFARGSMDLRKIELQVDELRRNLSRAEGEIDERRNKESQQAATQAERDHIEQQRKQELRQARERLSIELGVYEISGVEVSDYVTQTRNVPAGFFKTLIEFAETQRSPDGSSVPPLRVLVNIDEADISSRQQMVGMAPRDLYLLSAELPFWQNYFKWVLGLWCNAILILGVAVACSTYLSGIISLLVALFVYGSGMVVEFIKALAEGNSPGGGPFEAANRIFSRLPMAGPLEQTPTTSILMQLDAFYRYWLGLVLKLVPDMHRFNLTEYVSSGFDISWGEVLLLDNILPMLGYLLPWAVLAFYTINSREVANPT